MVHLIMVQCCCQYHFTFYFCESLILQIGEFLYFAGTNYFFGLVNLVSPRGNLFNNNYIQPFLYKLSRKYRQTKM